MSTRVDEKQSEPGRPGPRPVLLLIPLALMAVLIGVFLKVGAAGIFPGEFPPVEDVTIGKVDLSQGKIDLTVTNGGPSTVTIAQVLVDDAYWGFDAHPSGRIERLGSTRISLRYPWVEAEPVTIVLISSTGVTFEHTIDVATETPKVDGQFLWTFGLLGIYIGLIPVLLGMTWMPFLRTVGAGWLNFFLAFTAGVLIFLGVETVAEALEEAAELPTALGGTGVVAFGAIASFALILAAARWMKNRSQTDSRLVTAFTVAAGIGLHNLGEGLAVGAAYRLGEIALGAFLVIGFAIHNTTEGIGIVSVLGRTRTTLVMLAALGLVAGLPTVAGAWAGAFFFSPVLAAVFLTIAAGAIAEVVYDVLSLVRRESPGGLASTPALLGIAAGLAVMYVTGALVSA
ncbi:MAG: ZIP family metal transporter [Actinomycetota bacterium]